MLQRTRIALDLYRSTLLFISFINEDVTMMTYLKQEFVILSSEKIVAYFIRAWTHFLDDQIDHSTKVTVL